MKQTDTHATARRALKATIPVLAGYVVLGAGFGILLGEAGYGPVWSLAMCLFIYAGSMQYVGVGLIAGGAGLLSTILTTLMVNARHLFYSVSMLTRYRDAGKYKPYLIFALTDETYSLLCEGNETDRFRFFVSLFDQCYWVAGGLLGSLIGPHLPFSTAGIEFSMTALFIASFTEQWLTARDRLPALVGLAASLGSLIVFGPERFLIPAMLLITLAMTLLRPRLERGREAGV